MKGYVYGILLGIIMLSAPFIILSLSSASVANNPALYKKEFQKLGVNGLFEQGYPDEIADNLTAYFKHGPKNRLNASQLTSGELSHMEDVRRLISVSGMWAYLFIFIDLLLIFVIAFGIRQPYSLVRMTAKALIFCGLISIAAVMLILFSFLFFRSSFIGFHYIFFPQGNWSFDATSVIIRLFPQQFFLDLGLRIVLRAFIVSVLLFLLGFAARKSLKELPFAVEKKPSKPVAR
jgi:integral membrane protein (TIGR01906 family)